MASKVFDSPKYEHQLLDFIAQQMQQDLAHDLNHVKRVVLSARKIATLEKANMAIVVPAAYLHDCFSYPKDHPKRNQSSVKAADKACSFLSRIEYPNQWLSEIHHAICAHSYSAQITAKTLEAKVVQDADRLDALGAIGVTRCLQVSSLLQRPLYEIQDPFCELREADDSIYTIDHFYRKLLKLGDTMHTPAAKQEAKLRTQFMQSYLTQLKSELSN